MSKQISLYAKEEAELDAHEREMEEASGMIRERVVVFGRHLAEIHESGCWKARHTSFDAYCQERWRFTGTRGRQLVDAYGVAKNLASMTDEGGLPTYFYSYFTESHARELKHLPPEGQRAAWQAASGVKDEKGEPVPPTAKTLAKAVKAMGPTPEEIYRLPRDEQHRVISEMEAMAEREFASQRMADILALAQKRLRSVAEDIRADRFAETFRVGEFRVTGGIAGLVTVLQEECRLTSEKLASPLLERGA